MFEGVVAIDGPGGAGKSTVAKKIARLLNAHYLDTGAMYRALTWAVLHAHRDPSDTVAVVEVLGKAHIAPGTDPAYPTIAVDGIGVEKDIRSSSVTSSVSAVANVPRVREVLVAQQKKIIAKACAESVENKEIGRRGIVVEGRDIGTVVAPDAVMKIYLTASAQTRAQRRHGERDTATSVSQVQTDLARRDSADVGMGRAGDDGAGAARDAVVLDTTDLSIEDVVTRISELMQGARR